MHFKSLTLEDIRSYDDETVEFSGGENLIFGPNGAGKSTILQGLFGGLFQTNITRKKVNSDFNLDELIRKQADSGCIELTFVVGGAEYTVEWSIEKTYDDEGEVDGAKTKSGYPKLSSPAMEETISGFRAVQSDIQEIVGMDAISFVNSVYVQQGDITRLIHADTETRRGILDGLLGLDRMDELIERADDVRLEYGRAERHAKTRREETQNRLDDLPPIEDLDERIGELHEEKSDLNEQVDDFDDKLDRLEDRREENEDQLERIEELESEIEEVEKKLADARENRDEHKEDLNEEKSTKSELESELDEAEELLADAREAEAVEDIDLSNPDAAEEELGQAREEAENARSEVQSIEQGEISGIENDLDYVERDISSVAANLRDSWSSIREAQVEKKEAGRERAEANERVDALEEELGEKRAYIRNLASELDLPADEPLDTLADTYVPEKHKELNERREEVRQTIGQLETLEKQVDQLAESGRCPVCRATEEAHDIDAESVVEEHRTELQDAKDELDTLDEAKESLEEFETELNEARDLRDNELNDARQAVEDWESEVAEAEGDIKEAQEELHVLSGELEDKKADREDKNADLRDAKERLREAEERVNEAEETEDAVETVVELFTEVSDLRDDIQRCDENIENFSKLLEQAEDRVHELEERENELKDELGDLDAEELREEISEIDEFIAEFESKLDDAEEKLDGVKEQIVEHRQTKKQVREEKERKSMLDEQVLWAADHVEEAEELQDAYKTVRGKLRKRNLAKLNKYTNEMFAELYQSQSYRGVQIDKKYNIHLVTPDNELLEPELSSGGESTILNLALRAGVYRIIAEREGVGGAALPPFILDEPTTFLDEDHVGELQTMISTISEWDVPQVLVVSHDEHLIENSDRTIQVEKNPSTETSKVVRPDEAKGGA
ncbi:chromosome segregation protein SMC [Halorubrum sp. ASP121]|uniref:AAA family ATPase n=1 Tax=Halorubrum sp. ASP121 TaxID=1855858 RepID=UPI0010F5F282|nr:AAA family ATPase [Halorubrum sp. ASP121]TKX50106.1 chromosome segregation protein SMC [Halorubrum sp. ASP121]